MFLSDFGKEFGQFSSSVSIASVKSTKRKKNFERFWKVFRKFFLGPSSTSSLPGVKLGQTVFDDDTNSKREQTDIVEATKTLSINRPVFETPPPLNDLLFDDLPPPTTTNGITPKNFDIFDEPSTNADDDGNTQNFKNPARRNRTISNCSVKSETDFKQNSVVNEGGYYFK